MKYSDHINQISTNPGAFPRSIDNQYPLIVDRTRTLTASKCNIWRAMVLECTRNSIYLRRTVFNVHTKEQML